LAYGIGAAVQHGLLRLLLWRYHRAPLRYVRWLDYTVHLRLLDRGTGGGYVFIHRIVRSTSRVWLDWSDRGRKPT
jgi:hypothetical protein